MSPNKPSRQRPEGRPKARTTGRPRPAPRAPRAAVPADVVEAFGVDEAPGVRLNKFLAERGVASRRRCDELIVQGKVMVDGNPMTELGVRVDPSRQRVEVGGVVFRARPDRRRYYLLNKPRGVVCTNERREMRPRAIDLITDPDKGRIYTVGRLDEDSEGLILLTDDGEFTNLVTHPRHGIAKTYLVKARGSVEGEMLESLRGGVRLAEGRTGGARVQVLKRTLQFTRMLITLREGKNREVRRMLAKVGLKVMRLTRTRIGSLTDRRLKTGQWRPLTRTEIESLRAEALDPSRADAALEGLAAGTVERPRPRRPGGRVNARDPRTGRWVFRPEASRDPRAAMHGRSRSSKPKSPPKARSQGRRNP